MPAGGARRGGLPCHGAERQRAVLRHGALPVCTGKAELMHDRQQFHSVSKGVTQAKNRSVAQVDRTSGSDGERRKSESERDALIDQRRLTVNLAGLEGAWVEKS